MFLETHSYSSAQFDSFMENVFRKFSENFKIPKFRNSTRNLFLNEKTCPKFPINLQKYEAPSD
ncbi:16403_t:CDS:1, partial [Entrophospora sp. SA101]